MSFRFFCLACIKPSFVSECKETEADFPIFGMMCCGAAQKHAHTHIKCSPQLDVYDWQLFTISIRILRAVFSPFLPFAVVSFHPMNAVIYCVVFGTHKHITIWSLSHLHMVKSVYVIFRFSISLCHRILAIDDDDTRLQLTYSALDIFYSLLSQKHYNFLAKDRAQPYHPLKNRNVKHYTYSFHTDTLKNTRTHIQSPDIRSYRFSSCVTSCALFLCAHFSMSFSVYALLFPFL